MQPHSATLEPYLDLIPTPESISELGVSRPLLEELALKTIHLAAPPTLVELAAGLCLSYHIVDDLFRRLRSEQLTEVVGMTKNAPQIGLTSHGRSRALELLNFNQYAGPAPVSFADYVQQTRRQSVRNVGVLPPDIHRAYAHLVLDETTRTKLGTALNSGTSIFLYGPSGTGKTAIASAIPGVFSDDRVWIPWAVQMDGQIVTVYDTHLHSPINEPQFKDCDKRWVLCRRPTVLVGGELTLEMLELQLNPVTKFYTAPVQMKANNGVLIIDDFGRQRLRPDELLNRWVVPLDRGIDFLTLAGGRKVEIPFELFVVFATNLDPAGLADPAFLRRIQSKIKVGAVSPLQFHEIFRQVCDEWGMECKADLVDELMTVIREKGEPLRACHPRDFVNQIRWSARYAERDPVLDRDSLLAAVDAYFVSEDAS